MTAELKKIRRELVELQQYSRGYILEIRGGLSATSENLVNIMEEIGHPLNIQLGAKNLDAFQHCGEIPLM